MEEKENPPSHERTADKGAGERIRPGKHRSMQVARAGKRKLFRGKARETFLEWFAATGNCVYSAAKAGVAHQTVWKHRMKDPVFAEAFDRALDQGVVRAKARAIEDKIKGGPIAIDGDLSEVELEPADPAVVLTLVRERERAREGHRKQGRTPRVATNAEVEAALVKRLAAFSRRVKARKNPPRDGEGDHAKHGGGGSEAHHVAKDPLHHAASRRGPPPRPGEDR